MNLRFDRGIAASVTAPFFIALSILLVKLAGSSTAPFYIAGLGPLCAVPFLYLLAKLCGRSLGISNLITRARTPFIQVLVTRSILGQLLIIWGFTLTTTVKSILLLRLEPLFVLLWSVLLLKEKPTLAKFTLMLMLIFGSMLVVSPSDPISAPNLGDGLIALALLFLSFSYIPTQKVVQQASPDGLNILTCLLGGGALTCFALVHHGSSGLPATMNSFAPILEYSVVFFVFGASLYYFAFQSVKPWVIASFLSLEVVYGLALALTFMNERVTTMQIIGAAVMIATTLLIALYRKFEDRKRQERPEASASELCVSS